MMKKTTPKKKNHKNKKRSRRRYGPLKVIKMSCGQMTGRSYLAWARPQTRRRANKAAIDFYARPQHWYLLPKKVSHIFFVDSQFNDGGYHSIRFLQREDKEWIEGWRWIDGPNFVTWHQAAMP